MRKLVTNAEMTEIDRRSQEDYGIPGIVLMENAGQNAYRLLAQWLRSASANSLGGASVVHLLFVAGSGNNGGDALVMARACIQEGLHRVTVLLARDGAKGNAATNLDILRHLGATVINAGSSSSEELKQILDAADWIVDGVSGTGISGALRSPLSDIVEMVNASASRVCAVDVPSGVSDGYTAGHPAVAADLTLTMGGPKRCLYLPAARSRAGEIVTVPLGFPSQLLTSDDILVELAELSDLTHLLPAVSKDSYKTRRGVAAVFGGALGKTGAAALAAEAAGRSGAGMIHLYVDREVYPTVATGVRSLMVHPASEAVETDLEGAHAFIAGPGWGVGTAQRDALRACATSALPGVLDADALNTLSKLEQLSFGDRCVMTPHPGEFERLYAAYVGDRNQADGEGFLPRLQALAAAAACVVCYKSHVLYLVAPDGRVRVVDGMLPELATAGAGDVLAGIIGGLLARSIDPLNAATAGVLVHQAAAARCRDRVGWFIAEDLLSAVSGVLGDFTETVYL